MSPKPGGGAVLDRLPSPAPCIQLTNAANAVDTQSNGVTDVPTRQNPEYLTPDKIPFGHCVCCRRSMTLHRVNQGAVTCGPCRFHFAEIPPADPRPLSVPVDLDALQAVSAR